MKQLYILRHAKSGYPENTDDHDRPLNERGKDSCRLMGRYIKENNIHPQKILCSDAVRTSQTIKNILRAAGFDIPVIYTKSLYLATPGEILKEVAKVDDSVTLLMVVAHNPGCGLLARFLTETGDPEVIAQLKEKYPTAALACFSFGDVKWKDIQLATGKLEKFIAPKDL